jgi:Ni,Fe-hydrogenase I small subunit
MIPPNETFYGALQKKGVSRQRFLKFCTAMTATLALLPRYVAQVASALEKTNMNPARRSIRSGLRC